MAQQTAVEWLIKQLYTYELVDKNVHPNNLIFQKAKEMFQQQKKDAWYDSRLNNNLLFDDYYEITYGK